MTPINRDRQPVRIELWVWADRDCLDDSHDIALRRIERLEAADIIDSYDLHEWEHQLDTSSNAPRGERRDRTRKRLSECVNWARTNGLTLPLSEVHSAGSGRLGPTIYVRDLPRLVMVEYVDGEIACVTPHETETHQRSIEDRLDVLSTSGAWVSPELTADEATYRHVEG